jgi:hypothetical protein
VNQNRDWPAELQDRRKLWRLRLKNGRPVKDQFQLRNLTVIVRLKPYDPSNLPRLTEHLDSFVDRLDSMSRSLERVSPANPVRIDADAKAVPGPVPFFGYAYLLAEGVDAPPDD